MKIIRCDCGGFLTTLLEEAGSISRTVTCRRCGQVWQLEGYVGSAIPKRMSLTDVDAYECDYDDGGLDTLVDSQDNE